ncbi:MAG: ATP-binding protein [Deltaproteobacteria bacterium]|nr:ATP-binding protein [Deltaproteobacteria bacterium]
MTPIELKQHIAWGNETRQVEFKGPGRFTGKGSLSLKVVCAILGMANSADGGWVVVGVAEDALGKPVAEGIAEDDLSSWNKDDIADHVSNFADPKVDFDVEEVTLDDEVYVVIRVKPFDVAPVICMKDGNYSKENGKQVTVLRRGGLYVRGDGKVETRQVKTYAEMRALLDIAVSRGVTQFVRQARAANMEIAPDNSEELFGQELKKLDVSKELQSMYDAGRWRFWVRPIAYKKDAFDDVAKMEAFVREKAVQRRGWDLPYVDSNLVMRKQNGVLQSFDRGSQSERWAFFCSGQFILDRPQDVMGSDPNGNSFYFESTIMTLTEAFDFAAKLALLPAFAAGVVVAIEANHLKNRTLIADGFLPFARQCLSEDEFSFEETYETAEFLTSWEEKALAVAQNLFQLFKSDFSAASLKGIQDKFLQ